MLFGGDGYHIRSLVPSSLPYTVFLWGAAVMTGLLFLPISAFDHGMSYDVTGKERGSDTSFRNVI